MILAASADARAAPQTSSGCEDWKTAGGYQWLNPRVAPGTCTLLFRGHLFGMVPRSGTGKISGTQWKNWGHGTATGRGWLQLGVRGAKNQRATMKAYDDRILPITPELS